MENGWQKWEMGLQLCSASFSFRASLLYGETFRCLGWQIYDDLCSWCLQCLQGCRWSQFWVWLRVIFILKVYGETVHSSSLNCEVSILSLACWVAKIKFGFWVWLWSNFKEMTSRFMSRHPSHWKGLAVGPSHIWRGPKSSWVQVGEPGNPWNQIWPLPPGRRVGKLTPGLQRVPCP